MNEFNRIRFMEEAFRSDNLKKEQILEMISTLSPIPVISVRYLSGWKVLRSRLNNGIELFQNTKDLSYPPCNAATLSRLSQDGQPMFYCSGFSISTDKTNCRPRIVNVLETCPEFIKGNDDGYRDFTVGVWQVINDLKLITFPMDFSFDGHLFEEMKEIQSSFRQAKLASNESVKVAKYLGKLISSKGNSCLYEITSTVARHLLFNNPSAKNIDGILYPSVQSSGEGVNICIKPEVADKSLVLMGARKHRLYKCGKDSQIVDLLDADVDMDGKLIWGPIKR